MALLRAARRARAEAFITVSAAVTAALALTLVAAGPIFADAVSTGTLRRSLVDTPAAETAVVIDTRVPVELVPEVDEIVGRTVSAAFADVGALRSQIVETARTFAFSDQPDADRVDLARLSWVESIADHATLTSGVWPDDAVAGGRVPAAVDEAAAAALGLTVGAPLTLGGRQGSGSVEIEIVGLYQVVDPAGPFWHDRARLVEPLSVTDDFRTASLIVPRTALASAVFERPNLSWLIRPAFERMELDAVEPLRVRVANLEAEINGRLFGLDAEEPPTADVVSRLGDRLAAGDRSLNVARAVIFATVVQLSVLAGFALTLVAGLGVDARRAESALLRARGSGVGQLAAQALIEAVILVVPAAIAAPSLAVVVVGWFDSFGPLARIDLVLDPRPVAAAWIVTAIGAVLAIGLLAAPAVRAARVEAAEGTSAPRRSVSSWQRSGIDLAVVAAAGFVYWQLRVLSADRAASVRGRFGVDPSIIVAPALGLVAGALLVLRLLPLLTGRAERLVEQRRGVVDALAVWQVSRRPHRYLRTALLVTMAVSVGAFTAAYETTWSSSRADQAEQQVAADARFEPNRRVGDSVGPLQLSTLVHGVDGVDAVMAAVRLDAVFPSASGQIVGLELGSSEALHPSVLDGRLGGVADRLVDRRPDVPGVDLPGRPASLEFDVDIVETDELGRPVPVDDEAPGSPALAGSLVLSLVDGDGVFHTVDAGALSLGAPARRVDLMAPGVEGVGPRPPLRIVDVQVDTVTQGALSRRLELTLGPITVVDIAGQREVVDFGALPLRVDTEVLGFLASASSATVTTNPDERSLSTAIVTGSSLLAVRVVHTILGAATPQEETLAAAADRRWADEAGVAIGDVVALETDRIDGVRIEVVDLVDAVPSVDPTRSAAVMVDLPSLQWHERRPGREPRPASEYWLGLEAGVIDGATLGDLLVRPPIEATEAVVLSTRVAELTSDPPALGSLGALTMGYGAALLMAIAALVLTAVVSARERAAEFAVLDALGLSRRQRRAWLVREQAVLVGVGVLLGLAVGVGLSLATLPLLSLSDDAGAVYPPVVVHLPWWRILGAGAVAGGASLVAVAAALAVRSRRSTGTALRTGGGR